MMRRNEILLAGVLAALGLGSDPPLASGAQTPRPPTLEEHYGGPPPGVHDNAPPSSPADYDPGENPDPFTDPDHPLKGSQDPGPSWNDAAAGGGRAVQGFKPVDWNWQELFYDGTYATALHVGNRCPAPEPVYITHDLPYLTIQSTAVIPPGGIDVPATIQTPPEPPPPIRTGAPGEPGWGWVAPPHYDPATGTSVRYPGEPEFHQPNFVDIEGNVTVWHPWREPCLANRREWKVGGHIHFRPPPPEGGGGPEKIASPDPCVVYWNLGAPPPGFDDRDCTDVFRGLAIDTFGRVLGARIAADPDAWSWVPTADAIRTMSQADLLALKQRADRQIDAESAR